MISEDFPVSRNAISLGGVQSSAQTRLKQTGAGSSSREGRPWLLPAFQHKLKHFEHASNPGSTPRLHMPSECLRHFPSAAGNPCLSVLLRASSVHR